MRIRWLGIILAAALLAGCWPWRPPSGGGAGPRTEGENAGLKATAVEEGGSLRFTLEGYDGPEVPALRVTSIDGTDWTPKLDRPEREGGRVTAKLPGERGLVNLAVEQVEYRWSLTDGRTVGGSIQFRTLRFRSWTWQITRTGGLLIYHVRPLRKEDAANWDHDLQLAMAWTGRTRSRPLVVWVFPDLQSFSDWTRRVNIAGTWMHDIQRMVVTDEADRVEREVVILHEMVHALSPNNGPAWFEEGIAQLLESRRERQLKSRAAPRWNVAALRLGQLQQLARERQLDPAEAMGRRDDPPLDPYTLGVSVWLFVKHHHGDEGVRRLLAASEQENGIKAGLEELFGKPLPDIWVDWNAYLRGPQLLKDWENP